MGEQLGSGGCRCGRSMGHGGVLSRIEGLSGGNSACVCSCVGCSRIERMGGCGAVGAEAHRQMNWQCEGEPCP